MARSYKRRVVNSSEQRRTYLIICEGKKTETRYFNKYRTRYNNLNIVCYNSPHTDPIGLIRYAKTQMDNYAISIKDGDRVWCVFDVDDNTDTILLKAKSAAEKNKIDIIMSNPSFELWYLLHFCSYSTANIDNSTLLRRLKQYIPNYCKGECYFDILEPHTSHAIELSEKLIQHHKTLEYEIISTDSNPSTTVHELVKIVKS